MTGKVPHRTQEENQKLGRKSFKRLARTLKHVFRAFGGMQPGYLAFAEPKMGEEYCFRVKDCATVSPLVSLLCLAIDNAKRVIFIAINP